jgi:hypothetical protein
MLSIYTKLKKHWRHLGVLVFIFGFILDYLTLPNITNKYATVIGVAYAGVIFILLAIRNRFKLNEKMWLNLFIQFLLGNLTSFIVVYYVRGADVLVSLPVFILIGIFVLFNELVKSNIWREKVDIFIYALNTTFLFIFISPIIFKKINDITFAIAIAFSFVFIFLLNKIIKSENKSFASVLIYFIPGVILGFYFLQILPAVPLTLRTAEYYDFVERQSAGEFVLGEKYKKSFFGLYNRDVKLSNLTATNSKIFFYSETVAPIDLEAKVSHIWEKKNKNNDWIVLNEVEYTMLGGRNKGYRGYSYVNITPYSEASKGEYRVRVMIDGNRYLGKSSFTIK